MSSQAAFGVCQRWLRRSGWCRRSAQESSLSLQRFPLRAAVSVSRKEKKNPNKPNQQNETKPNKQRQQKTKQYPKANKTKQTYTDFCPVLWLQYFCLCPALFYTRFRHVLLVSWAFAEGWCFKVRDMAVMKWSKCTKSPLEEWKQQIAMHKLECQRIHTSGRDLVMFLPYETSDISQKRLPVGSSILWDGEWVSD